MKNRLLNTLLTAVFIFTLSVSDAFPKDKVEFFANPILFNGKASDYNALSWVSFGKISLVSGNPESVERAQIPFHVYLMRAGKIIETAVYTRNNTYIEFEMSDILRSARAGDQIVIDPADKSKQAGKRAILVRQKQLAPPLEWWLGLSGNKKGGC